VKRCNPTATGCIPGAIVSTPSSLKKSAIFTLYNFTRQGGMRTIEMAVLEARG